MMAVGLAVSVRLSKAVLEAILGVKSDFVRTPKFNIDGQSGSLRGKKYRNRAGVIPYLEVAFGAYFAFTTIYAIQNKTYRTVPFLLLFGWGFLYTGVMSLGQGWWARQRPHAWRRPTYASRPDVFNSTKVFPVSAESVELTCRDTVPTIEGRFEPPQIMD
jgi:hypothetical protein